ncbi:MAG: [protein-PII] uridylyltransferase [Acidimicrobiales bacterium]
MQAAGTPGTHGTPGAPGARPGGAPSPLRTERESLSGAVLRGELAPLDLPPRYSEAADDYLAGLFERATSSRPSGYALVAVGGYGRRELCPGSDLDVVLLHDKRRDVKQVADAIWYQVWDTGVRLDHSVRTPREMLAVAGQDLRAILGLLDGRVISGDRPFAEGVLAKIAEIWRAHHRKWLPQLAAATRERHSSFGELPYLLEPDLKESAGGLRDLEAMSLTARALPSLAEVIRPPSLDGDHDLLLAARVALQARTGDRSDRLRLQEQDEVAATLGYADADRFAAGLAEAGREVMWASEDGWRRIDSVLRGPARRSASRETEVDRQIVLRDGEIALGPAAEPAGDPTLVLRAAAEAARHEVPIAVSSLDRLERERPELTSPWPEGMRDALVSLLEYGRAATPVIETLDRRRLFEWLLPEWRFVRHRPQRNAYHRFTVDRHLLEAVAEAASLLRNVERPDLLLIGALLHDIGKGRPGDHSEVGRELAGGIARRMGYHSRDVAVIERLVKRHLLLADTATRRDLDDPETTELVAEAVGDRLTLELLAALTEADSIATGPAAWGGWKAALVFELVENVRALFEGRPVDSSTTRQVSPQVATLVANGELAVEVEGSTVTVVAPDRPGLFALVAGTLAMHSLDIRRASALGLAGNMQEHERPAMAVEVFEVDRDPERPIDKARLLADLESALSGTLPIEAHLRTIEEAYARYRRPASARSPEVVVLIDESASSGAAVVEVRAHDSHGLLHRLASVLAEAGLDVVSARIATLGHEVVDSFYVREQQSGARPASQRLEQLRPALVAAAQSEQSGANT